MVGALLFFTGASIMFFWRGYTAFVIALCLTTLGLFLYFPSMQAYISDHVVYERRGRVLAVIEMGWALSFILGMPLIAFCDRALWLVRAVFPAGRVGIYLHDFAVVDDSFYSAPTRK